jgi:hypothetical protein
VTPSFNLASTSTVGAAVSAVEKATADLHMPPSIATSFQGNAQAFQSSLSSTPILILAALVAIYLILGVLYESTILGALLALMLVGMPLDVIGVIGTALLIGIVKKNGIMLVDFRARGGTRSRAEQRGRHPPGMYGAVPHHPDDDAGRAARGCAPYARNGNRIGNSPAARLCDCRWSVHLAAAGAFHNTGRLHLHEPTKRLDGTTAPAQWRGACRPCGLARQ